MNPISNTLTCKLTTPELQRRRATVIAELQKIVSRREEVSDGLKLTFQSNDETLDKLLDFIKSERLCCDFFSFQLFIVGEHAVLGITGPEGTVHFLEQEVGL